MNNLPQNDFDTPKRITWASTWSDVLDVIDFEKGILLTIKELVLKPKNTVNDYLYGNRSKYANPLRFLLFSTAIITLLNFYLVFQPSIDKGLFSYTDTENSIIVDFNADSTTLSNDIKVEASKSTEGIVLNNKSANNNLQEEGQEVVQNAINELFNWMDKFTFAMVPIFSIFTFWFFRKTKYNYTENLVINAFMISVTNVIGIFFVIPSYYFSSVGGTIMVIISSGFTLYFTFKVFSDNSVKGALKVLAAFVISYALYFLMMIGFLLGMILNSADKLQTAL